MHFTVALNITLIISVVYLMYYRTLSYGYVIDDSDVAKNKTLTPQLFKRLWEHFIGRKYTHPKLAHLLNIIIHTIVCILIYIAFGVNNTSLLAAILFALNPVNNQVSIWLSGRPYGTATALVLLAMIFKPLMLLFYPASIVVSVSAMMLPFIIIRDYPLYALLLLGIGYFSTKKRCAGEISNRLNVSTGYMTELSPRKIIIVLKTIGYYLCLCILPIRVGMFHDYLHCFGMSKYEADKNYNLDHYFWIGSG
jgi:hypothetical protein